VKSENRPKVNFRYHNPNTDDETLKILTKLFVEASRVKFENVIRKTTAQKDADIVEKEPS